MVLFAQLFPNLLVLFEEKENTEKNESPVKETFGNG